MKLLIILILFYFAYGSAVNPVTPLCENDMYGDFIGRMVVPASNSTARGYGILTFSKDNTEMHYQLMVLGFTSDVKSIILYPGNPGIVQPGESFLDTCIEARIEGRWGDESTIPLEPSLIKALKLGEGYLTIQTEKYPNGEIGGPIYCSQRDSYYPCCNPDKSPILKKDH